MRPTGRTVSARTRGRQLLYWESLKSKNRDEPSMTWRGNGEFAHEVPAGFARLKKNNASR